MKRAAIYVGGSAVGGAIIGLVIFLGVAWIAEDLENAEWLS